MRASASRPGDRLLLVLLLCLAILPKALVPVGWMPSAEGLVVCGGWAPKRAAEAPPSAHSGHHGSHEAAATPHHANGGSDDDDSHDRSSQPCAFSGAAMALDAVAGPALAAFAPPSGPALPVSIAYATGRGLAAPPPPATGPPILT